MNQQWEEALSALADGEDVDPVVLEAALVTPEGRGWLVEILRLRRLVRQDLEEPRSLAARTHPVRPWRWTRSAVAAVIVALSVFGALDLAHRVQVAAEKPPKAARVVRFEPGVDWQEVRH